VVELEVHMTQKSGPDHFQWILWQETITTNLEVSAILTQVSRRKNRDL
jgi:hypothetical protein